MMLNKIRCYKNMILFNCKTRNNRNLSPTKTNLINFKPTKTEQLTIYVKYLLKVGS